MRSREEDEDWKLDDNRPMKYLEENPDEEVLERGKGEEDFLVS